MLRRALIVAALPLVSLGTSAHQPGVQQSTPTAPQTGVLTGQTIDGTSSKPVGGTFVELTGGPSPARVMTDSEGRFVFHSLPKGSYSITASKSGYQAGAYGRRIPEAGPGLQIVLGDRERRSALKVMVWKYAAIGGTVTDEAGEPVIGVRLRVLKRALVAGRTRFTQFGNMPTTDDRGQYRIASLAPGDYVVGMLSTQTTMPAALVDAQTQASATGNVIQFVDELSRSAGLLNAAATMGQWQRIGTLAMATPTQPGDDLANPPIAGERVFAYPSVFYPAAPVPSQATVISLGSGQEKSGVDFSVTPVPTVRVSGRLLGPGGPEPQTALHLMSAGAGEVQRDEDFAAATSFTDAAGAFTFLGVAPGRYQLRAMKIPLRPAATPTGTSAVIRTGTATTTTGGGPSRPAPIPDEPTLWTTMPLVVGESDVTDLVVNLRHGVRVSGSLVFEGAAPQPAVDRLAVLSLQFDSADGRTTSPNQLTLARAYVDPSGRFNTYQLPSGRYTIRVAAGAVPGWTLKAALAGGVDIADTPLALDAEDVTGVVVTFTDTPTEISGTVRNDKGVGEQSVSVLVFPADPRGWTDFSSFPRRLRAVRPDPSGTYRVPGLPAGDYMIVAVEPERAAEWQTPSALQTLAATATRVTLADAEKKSLDLKASVRR